MAVDPVQAPVNRVQGDVSSTPTAPTHDSGSEVRPGVPPEHDPVRAEVFDRPSNGTDAITQPFPFADDLVGIATEEYEAIREAGRPFEGDFTVPTKPDRDGPPR